MDQPPDVPGELLRRIVRAVARECPSDWQKAELAAQRAGRLASDRITAVRTGGREVQFRPSADCSELLTRLRAQMRHPERGAWFTARIHLTRLAGATEWEPRVTTEFDHDSEPEWESPVGPAVYREDLAAFPRSPEHVPEWLARKIGRSAPAPDPTGPTVSPDRNGASPVSDQPGTPAPSPDSEVLRLLAWQLQQLGVPPTSYRIGERADGAWCLESRNGHWRVTRYEQGEPREAVRLTRSVDAAAYLLGRLLLTTPRAEVPGPGAMPAPPASASAAPVTAPPVSPTASVTSRFPPPPGDPPLSLYRDLTEVALPTGTLLDRLGEPTGTVTYLAGTPFPQRSLPPDWAHREYHRYQLTRSLNVLTGVAVPWFDQPGGGRAVVLPAPVHVLLAQGVLVEVGPPPPAVHTDRRGPERAGA